MRRGPFEAELAFGAGVRFRAGFKQLVPADGFRADEVVLEIGVDGSSGFNGARADRNCPGPALVLTDGEK